MLSPQEQAKYKTLMQKVEQVLGKTQFAEFMDLAEKAEDEGDQAEEQSESQKESGRAQAIYPNQGQVPK